MSTVSLNVHGVTLRLEGDSEVVEAVGRDFSYFRVPVAAGMPDVRVTLHGCAPAWQALPNARSVMVQPGCVIYRAGEDRWVDYHSKALARWHYETETGEIWSDDPGLLHEIAYLLVHSRVGELLDRRGIHRLHAMALAVDGRAFICTLPSGGGKTTLALGAMRTGLCDFVSDDTPLVKRDGTVLPFPIRIGLCAPPPDIPERYVRRFRRREHGEKWLVDAEAFGGRIAAAADPGVLVIGERALNGPASLLPIPRRAIVPELFRSGVVGVGLPQLVEYFLRFEVGDAARKAALVASRTLAMGALLARSDAYRFVLARDPADNLRALTMLIRERTSDTALGSSMANDGPRDLGPTHSTPPMQRPERD